MSDRKRIVVTGLDYHSLSPELSSSYRCAVEESRKNLAWFWVTTEKERFEKSIGAPANLSREETVDYFLTTSPSINDPTISQNFYENHQETLLNISWFLLATKEEQFKTELSHLIKV